MYGTFVVNLVCVEYRKEVTYPVTGAYYCLETVRVAYVFYESVSGLLGNKLTFIT